MRHAPPTYVRKFPGTRAHERGYQTERTAAVPANPVLIYCHGRILYNILHFTQYILYRVLVGKPEGKRPLGRPRLRWVDNIRMDLQDVGCGYMDWIGLAQDRDRWRTLVSAVMNLRVP